jgi:iron complex outermembrane recepter protein
VLTATARVDNLLDRRYAGSVIVNEGNGRFFESAPGRNYILKVSGSYAF